MPLKRHKTKAPKSPREATPPRTPRALPIHLDAGRQVHCPHPIADESRLPVDAALSSFPRWALRPCESYQPI